ncbi:hypothetical protein [Weissella kandleri]|nr:hypothetical protein [Weissella kandleri]
MQNVVYFVTDINRRNIIMYAENEPLLHQKLLDAIENNEMKNVGGYRMFKTNKKEFNKILMKIKSRRLPFYKIAVPKPFI